MKDLWHLWFIWECDIWEAQWLYNTYGGYENEARKRDI